MTDSFQPPADAPKTETILKANVDTALPSEIAEAEEERQWSGPAFWGRWVGVTTLGWAVGGAALGAVAGLTGSTENVPFEVVSFAGTLFIVTLQWLVLRRHFPRAWRWIPVGLAGEAVGFALFLALKLSLRSLYGGPSMVEGVTGLFVQAIPSVVAQWLLLRTYSRRAWRWLLANLIWLVLFVPVVLMSGVGGEDFQPSSDLAVAAAIDLGVRNAALGFVASAIVAAELVWLLKHPKQPRSPRVPHLSDEPAIH